MCVCVCSQEVLVRQAGCAGSVWLGGAASYVAALRIADAGDEEAKIPCFCPAFTHQHTHEKSCKVSRDGDGALQENSCDSVS